jgi:DNA repair protein RadC
MYRIPIYQVRLVRDGSQRAERKKVNAPATAAEVLHQYLADADREHFVVLLLDTQNQIIGIHTVTVGTLDASYNPTNESIPCASCCWYSGGS